VRWAIRSFPDIRVPLCRWTASTVTRQAASAVERLPRPYFLTLNYMDAHSPYYVETGCPKAPYPPFNPERDFALPVPLPHNERVRLFGLYDAAVACMDRSLGKFIDTLNAQADANNTIIVIVGDHGEQFGMHNILFHGNSVYRQVLRVPLVLRYPGAQAARVTEPVSITDLYPTLLGLAGISPGYARRALPFSDAIAARQPVISILRAATGRWEGLAAQSYWSAIEGPFHLVRGGDGEEQLFDYRHDPEELVNRAADPKLRSVHRELSAVLETIADQPNPQLTRDQLEELHSVGYFQ
jgi:arylsulfatase A-like enzyme